MATETQKKLDRIDGRGQCLKCGAQFHSGDDWMTFECGTFHTKCVNATLEQHVLPKSWCPCCGEDVQFPNTELVCGKCAKKPLTHGNLTGGSIFCSRCYDDGSLGEQMFRSTIVKTGQCSNCKVHI